MICIKCGRKNKKGAKFCNSCGAIMEQDHEGVITTGSIESSSSTVSYTLPAKAAKKKPPLRIILAIAIPVIVIVLATGFILPLLNAPDETEKPARLYPQELDDRYIVKIVSGVSFSVALDDRGDLYIWGTECNADIDGYSDYILNIPQHIKDAYIVDVEAGRRHVIAVDNQGYFYGWGFNGHEQLTIPDYVNQEMAYDGFTRITGMAAMTRWSAIMGDNGYVYLWGSMSAEQLLSALYQADRASAMAAGENHVVLIQRDGTIFVAGQPGMAVVDRIPDRLTDGSVKVVAITATDRNALALDDTGRLWVWGSPEYGLNKIPTFSGNVTAISGGYENFVVVTDEGEIIIWGSDELNQLEIPENLTGKGTGAVMVYSDYIMFYAVDSSGNILGAWGTQGEAVQ